MKERNLLPRWWYRYVDDVVAVIKKSELEQTLQMLNSQFPTIKFTVVPEEDGQLAFLDLLLIRKNNKVELAVFINQRARNVLFHRRHIVPFNIKWRHFIQWLIDCVNYLFQLSITRESMITLNKRRRLMVSIRRTLTKSSNAIRMRFGKMNSQRFSHNRKKRSRTEFV